MTRNKPYRVTVERSGEGWRVRMGEVGGLCTLRARDLADVELQARRLVWAYTSIAPDDVVLDLDLRLPGTIFLRLSLAEELVDEATAELETAIFELLEAGVSLPDIDRILKRRGQVSSHQLTILGREISEHGLAHHPDATGIQWDDHGRFLTRICRECLVKKRPIGFEIDPDAECVLVYEEFDCHSCPPTRRDDPEARSFSSAA